MSMDGFALGERPVGPGASCLVIAEAGVNHNGDLHLAHRLIDAAAHAGADAVKFQTFSAERLVSPRAPKAAYQRRQTGEGGNQLDMLKELELSADDFGVLQQHAHDRHILFLSTPFDEESADMLAGLDVPAFKLGSGEVTNLPLLRHVAAFGRPVILSTGMAYLGEVEVAVRALREGGCEDLALLHCVSNYPADPADANLLAMATLAAAFAVPVGYSDHTPGVAVALAAVAMGACIIEKHFTLDQSLPGPDHAASLEPGELQALVRGIRTVETAFGDGIKEPRPAERDTRQVARRSLFLRRAVRAGDFINAGDLVALRPADGISPADMDKVIGRPAARALAAGSLLTWDLIGARPAVRAVAD